MALDLSSLKKAVASLDAAIEFVHGGGCSCQQTVIEQNVLKAGVIQNFEFTYELCWKFMQRYLKEQLGRVSYVEGVSRIELFRLSAEHGLIDDVAAWMDYHKARNLTSHTYDEDVADEVYQSAVSFIVAAKKFLAALEAHND